MNEKKTREWILKRTTDRFLSGGGFGFTMDEIARDAGVSKKTLYRLIPSKNDLIKMVLDGQIQIVEAKQKSVLEDSTMGFSEKLEALFRIVSVFFSSIHQKSSMDMARLSPETWEMVRQRREGILDRIIRLLEEGRTAGIIKGDIPPSLLGRFFHSTIDSLLTPRLMMEENVTLNDLFDMTLSLIFTGIMKPTGGAV